MTRAVKPVIFGLEWMKGPSDWLSMIAKNDRRSLWSKLRSLRAEYPKDRFRVVRYGRLK